MCETFKIISPLTERKYSGCHNHTVYDYCVVVGASSSRNGGIKLHDVFLSFSLSTVCPPGKYGNDCSTSCPNKCAGKGCHTDGSCLQECPAGKISTDCSQSMARYEFYTL